MRPWKPRPTGAADCKNLSSRTLFRESCPFSYAVIRHFLYISLGWN